MFYELAESELLDTLLIYAGGFLPDATTSATRVVRLENGSLDVIDLDQSAYASFNLRDGDMVEIPGVSEPIRNYVEISGEVVIKGRYGIRSGLTLGDVIKRARLQPTARRDVAFIQRGNDDGTRQLMRVSLAPGEKGLDTPLRRGDAISVLASSRYVDQAVFSISGAVRGGELKSTFPLDGALSLEEAILLAGGLEPNALQEALIIRTPRQNADRREYIRIPLSAASETRLEPFDQVVIYASERFEDVPTVSIDGAVRAPIETRYDSTLSIDDLLYLAGGAKFEAAANRVEVYRLSLEGNETRTLFETLSLDDEYGIAETFELRAFDEIYIRSSADFEPIQEVSLEGELRYPGTLRSHQGF